MDVLCAKCLHIYPRSLCQGGYPQKTRKHEDKQPNSSQTRRMEELFVGVISNLSLWFWLSADVWTWLDSAGGLLLPGSGFPPATKSKAPTGSEAGASLQPWPGEPDLLPAHRQEHSLYLTTRGRGGCVCRSCFWKIFVMQRKLPHTLLSQTAAGGMKSFGFNRSAPPGPPRLVFPHFTQQHSVLLQFMKL